MIYLSENHFFKLKMGIGIDTNNYIELMSLKLLLVFAGENVSKTFIFLMIQLQS